MERRMEYGLIGLDMALNNLKNIGAKEFKINILAFLEA